MDNLEELVRKALEGSKNLTMVVVVIASAVAKLLEDKKPLIGETKELAEARSNYIRVLNTERERQDMLKEAADLVRRQEDFNRKWKLLPPGTPDHSYRRARRKSSEP